MSDLSGLYAVVGAAIGALGAQLTSFTKAVSKSRARRAKEAVAEKESKAVKRRPLYEGMINGLDKTAEYIAWTLETISDPQRGPGGAAQAGLREVLGPLREHCVAIQIDGSDHAMHIATDVLAGTYPLWWELSTLRKTIFSTPALSKARAAVLKGHAKMVEVSRRDLGG